VKRLHGMNEFTDVNKDKFQNLKTRSRPMHAMVGHR